MKKQISFLFFLLVAGSSLFSQSSADSITDEMKSRILNNFKHFTVGFYIDSYVTMELDDKNDTSNIIPYAGNCPLRNQIRLNVAAIEMNYNDANVRGKLQLQFGDAPNLLASPEKQFIKNIRQAYIGIRVVKELWAEAGFMFTPVGVESAWPVINYISTVSMCGYFEPGAMLGIKLSYKFSSRFDGGFLLGNPYSLAYQQTNHLAAILFLNYRPLKNLTVSYNNIFGNQALKNAEIKNNILYNQFIATWNPNKNFNLLGQFDFAFQSNSGLAPDTNNIGSMCSGFIIVRYNFLKHFSLSGRYEYFHDPAGFLSGQFTYDNKTTGLTTNGMALSLEYKPVAIAYIRGEYKYLHANKGNNIYYSNTEDRMQVVTFTTGVRF